MKIKKKSYKKRQFKKKIIIKNEMNIHRYFDAIPIDLSVCVLHGRYSPISYDICHDRSSTN